MRDALESEPLSGGHDRRWFLGTLASFLMSGALASCCSTPRKPLSSMPVDDFFEVKLEGPTYCRYQVTKISPVAPGQKCPFKLLDVVCVDCPEPGNCLGHASVGRRKWRLWSDSKKTTLVCEGEWVINNQVVVGDGKVTEANCEACPDNGQRGYQFI
ncbi:MAG TPA: hypothetical protein VHR45_24965 [Thermoanaerobaculia bacterium]|nr:hypothetical protein [Thermoanaerobaculia bacterium]